MQIHCDSINTIKAAAAHRQHVLRVAQRGPTRRMGVRHASTHMHSPACQYKEHWVLYTTVRVCQT